MVKDKRHGPLRARDDDIFRNYGSEEVVAQERSNEDKDEDEDKMEEIYKDAYNVNGKEDVEGTGTGVGAEAGMEAEMEAEVEEVEKQLMEDIQDKHDVDMTNQQGHTDEEMALQPESGREDTRICPYYQIPPKVSMVHPSFTLPTFPHFC